MRRPVVALVALAFASWIFSARAYPGQREDTPRHVNQKTPGEMASGSEVLVERKQPLSSVRCGGPTARKMVAMLFLGLNAGAGWKVFSHSKSFALSDSRGPRAGLHPAVAMKGISGSSDTMSSDLSKKTSLDTYGIGRRAALAAGLVAATPLSPAFAMEGPYCLACKIRKLWTEGAPGTSNFKVIDLVEVGSNPDVFNEMMKDTLAMHDPKKNSVLVWVQSDAPDGIKPWCPDTRAALPILERALRTANGLPIVLVIADVVRGEYKGNPSYAYRTNKQLKLRGVPTLYRWGETGPTQRLVEGEITDEAVAKLMQ